MLNIRRILILCVLMTLVSINVSAVDRLKLATTTSTENSGLLAVLLPPFEVDYGCKVDVIATGTGKALKLGETGDVDIVLVHARSKEDAFLSAGYGINRRDVMYNDFVLLGPASDPAEIRGQRDTSVALRYISSTRSPFVSRGDDSGTHVKELSLWKHAEITPVGGWYYEAGRGMGDVIVMASEKSAYTLSDRGTYLAFKTKTDLTILSEGDSRLFNPYGVIAVNPKRHPHVKRELATDLISYLTSEKAQRIIEGYKMSGEQLFFISR